MEEFGGSLELDLSDPAEGACFVLRLPGQGGANGDTATRSAS